VGSRYSAGLDECEWGSALEEESGAEENEPYAKLIYRALMSAPGHRMVLKEIYDWFATHTDKNKNPSQKGWQNSIRHNLSMNGVSARLLLGLHRRLSPANPSLYPLIGLPKSRTRSTQ
jgi:hypothetical protein